MMTIEQAEALASALYKAIDAARADGRKTVDVQSQLQVMDDAARADLQAAIDAAKTT